MYFIEKLIKFYMNFQKKEHEIIAPEFNDNYVLEDVVTCSHNFVQIDSSGETFACSKCGFIVPKSRLKQNL